MENTQRQGEASKMDNELQAALINLQNNLVLAGSQVAIVRRGLSSAMTTDESLAWQVLGAQGLRNSIDLINDALTTLAELNGDKPQEVAQL